MKSRWTDRRRTTGDQRSSLQLFSSGELKIIFFKSGQYQDLLIKKKPIDSLVSQAPDIIDFSCNKKNKSLHIFFVLEEIITSDSVVRLFVF